MTDSLELATRELLARLDTEAARPPGTPGTTLAGGITKVGGKLESLLRALLEEVAGAEGVRAEALLPNIGGRPVSLRRATGGQLVGALKNLHLSRVTSPRVKALASDLMRPTSRVAKVIAFRNEVAHEGTLPRDVGVALADLRQLVAACRRDAGWG